MALRKPIMGMIKPTTKENKMEIGSKVSVKTKQNKEI